jgi:hypothetical protein
MEGFVGHGKNAYKSNVLCVSYSILPMIYQYFWRVRLAIIRPE